MRHDLWPYYSTKTKAFFKDGSKRFQVIRKSKYEFQIIGDRTRKVINWNLFERLDPGKIILTYEAA